MSASYEQDRLNLIRDFGHDWVIWPASLPLDTDVTWVGTRKRKPTTDEAYSGILEYVACENPEGMRAELLDQAHLEAALLDLARA